MPIYAYDGILTKESIAVNDLVLLEVLEYDEDSKKYGDIILPEISRINTELMKCKVLSVGPAASEFFISPNDNVLIDRWSVFGGAPDAPGTLVLTKVENVILVYKSKE